MDNRQERLKAVYDYLREAEGIHTKKDLAIKIGQTQPAMYSAFSGNADYLTDSLFRRICMAFPAISLDWLLTGSGSMLKGATVPAASAAAPPPSSPSPAPTSQDALIAELRQHIEELRQRIADKEEIIRAKDALILELRRNYSTCYRLDMVAETK